MSEKLKSTNTNKNDKDKSLSIKLCSACYSYICAETNAIFEKMAIALEDNSIRKSNLQRAMTSRLSGLSPGLMSMSGGVYSQARKDTMFNFTMKDESSMLNPLMKYMSRNNLLHEEISESLLDPESKKDFSNVSILRDVVSDMDDQEIVDFYLGLFPELKEHSQAMVSNIMVKVKRAEFSSTRALAKWTPR